MPRARSYLDWNASAPLSATARAAMIDAMDQVGNPSSQHADGRAARAIIDRARAAVAALAGCAAEEVIFTSGATEAVNAVVLAGGPFSEIAIAPTEHAAALGAANAAGAPLRRIGVDQGGAHASPASAPDGLLIQSAANSETGLLDPRALRAGAAHRPRLLDATQLLGKAAFTPAGDRVDFAFSGDFESAAAAISAHKIGGPKGVGALLFREDLGLAPPTFIHGGGQEFRRRSGTENLIGVAGFAAAAEELLARPPDWEAVKQMRDALENRLAIACADLVVVRPSGDCARLANTTMFAAPGWRADAQLIQLDMAGFSVSAGSACSSGKMTTSPVLSAMGYSDAVAASAIRVSIGPSTTAEQIDAFAAAWARAYERHAARR